MLFTGLLGLHFYTPQDLVFRGDTIHNGLGLAILINAPQVILMCQVDFLKKF